MLQNYLKVAFRNLLRYKSYSVINILGLTFGMTCCLLIYVYVIDELSYDKFHVKADRIYRLQYNIENFNLVRTPPPMSDAIREFFSEIEAVGRLYNRNASVEINKSDVTDRPDRFEEERLFFVDSTVFDIFSFEIIEGQKTGLLNEPFTVVLNEELAKKYFGNESAIGQTVRLEARNSFKVIAVAKDLPPNSHWHFNMLLPYDNMYDIEPENVGPVLRQNLEANWLTSHSFTYMTLKEGQRPESVEARFPDFLEANLPGAFKRNQNFNLQPLLDIRLNPDLDAQVEPVGNQAYVYLFIAIAISTLLIACINFINLSTARSLQRVKEVGMRKVMGAWKTQLVFQFLGESLLMSFIAFFLAIILAVYCLPVLNDLTDKSLDASHFLTPPALTGFIALFLTSGLAAGLYPAFFVTRVQPALSLKGILAAKLTKGGNLRRTLVVVQFTVAIILITGTVVIYEQVHLFRNRPLGFNKEQVITIPLFSPNFNNVFGGVNSAMRQRLNTYEDEIATNPRVVNSTLSDLTPGLGVIRRVVVPEGFTEENSQIAAALGVDYDFVQTYQLDIVAGRNFDESFGADHQNAAIINETAIQHFGFGSVEEALGKRINLEGKETKVVGVVRDFHFEPLQTAISPLILHIQVPIFAIMSVRIQSQNIPETLEFLESKWNSSFPEKAFEYNFLDEQLEENYRSEARLGEMINYFAFLAVLISCLGSYGLVMFLAQQKMKEIGIRKVLGATVGNIILLLSRNFALLIAISFVLSVPVAYYFINDWLDAFTLRVALGFESFLLAGLVTFAIIMITISYQAITAALANPVTSLRQE